MVAGPWAGHDLGARLMDAVAGMGPWALPVIVGLMIAHNLVPIPAEAIALAAGAILGPVLGAVAVWVGAMLGAVLAFWMSRRWGRDVVRGWLPPRHRDRLDILDGRSSWQVLLLVRLVPLISFNLVNYAAGLTVVRWRVYLWTTAIGIVPVIVLSVYAGAHMEHLGAYLGLWP